MNKARYKNQPIGSIESLSKALSVEPEVLQKIADKADSLYIYIPQKKSDGTIRDVYNVKPELKSIQKKLVKKLIHNTYFPKFLHGSIKDPDSPRTYITAAETHLGAELLLTMDISNFFPSLKSEIIFEIWKYFYNSPESVAKLLTALTTLNGALPQGAPTSPGLANLAFWDIEPQIVEKLQENNYRYTRYVDDVVISTTVRANKRSIEPIITEILRMFRRKGLKPSRKKLCIKKRGEAMRVHGLNLNGDILTVPQKKRKEIRRDVHLCEKHFHEDNQSEEYETLWDSTWGKVNTLKILHPQKANNYVKRLQAVAPVRI